MPEDLPNDTEHALPEGRYGDPSDPCLDAAAAAYLGVRLQTVYAMEARGVLKGEQHLSRRHGRYITTYRLSALKEIKDRWDSDRGGGRYRAKDGTSLVGLKKAEEVSGIPIYTWRWQRDHDGFMKDEG